MRSLKIAFVNEPRIKLTLASAFACSNRMAHRPLLSGYDEPETLPYQIRQFGPMGADPGRSAEQASLNAREFVEAYGESTMTSLDLLCLGEPLVEFNEMPNGSFSLGFGGDVSNVAVAVARAGASAGMITNVGDDLFGRKFIDLWQREKVDQTCVNICQGFETGLYFVTHDEGGHHFNYRRRNSAASRLKAEDLPLELIKNSRVFYSSGISLAIGGDMRSACLKALKVVKRVSSS